VRPFHRGERLGDLVGPGDPEDLNLNLGQMGRRVESAGERFILIGRHDRIHQDGDAAKLWDRFLEDLELLTAQVVGEEGEARDMPPAEPGS